MTSRPRLLVTGATGFIGRHLVPRLIDQGFPTTLLLREAYGLGRPLPPGLAACRARVDLVYADLRNFALTSRALNEADPEVILHLAAAGTNDPFLDLNAAIRHNVSGTLNLLRAAPAGHGTPGRRLLVARTPGERSAINVYAASKRAAWTFCQMYARTHGWPVSGLMIFQTYGPGQNARALVPAALAAAGRGEDFPMTSGRPARDWIYVTDVVDALAAAAATSLPPGETLELGTGRGTSVRQVVEMIYRLVGRGGRPLVGALSDRPGEVPLQLADIAASQEQLGWRPRWSLPAGLAHMWQQMKDRLPGPGP